MGVGYMYDGSAQTKRTARVGVTRVVDLGARIATKAAHRLGLALAECRPNAGASWMS